MPNAAFQRTTFTRGARLGLLALLALYGARCYLDPHTGHIIDSVDLAIHETGHLVFRPFGEWIQFAGGTLFQLIVPLTFLAYFEKFAPERDDFAAAIMIWWVAVNLWNIGIYAADARAQVLPLVGGGEHDWAYLLGSMGLLARDQAIGATFRGIGSALYIFALIAGARAALKPPPVPVDEPEPMG